MTNGGTTGTAGGAIFNAGSITLTNCDVTNNVGGASGGAIYSVGTMSSPTSITATDCNFINNSVTTQAGWGGVIINALGTVNIKNSNFINNQANQGGIIYNNYGTGTIQFCRIIGNTPAASQIYADAGSFIDATLNWWGSNAGPGSSVSSNVDVSSWLVLTVTGNPSSIVGGGQSQLIADFQYDNFNNYYDPVINGHVPNGLQVTFAGDALGTVNPLTGLTDNGQATTTFTAGNQDGIAHPTASLDLATVPGDITISAPLLITNWNPASNAVNVPTNTVITVTFNRAIQAGTMFIELKNKAGALIATTFSITGNQLKITPVSRLAEDKYTVYLHTGCVTDLNGAPSPSANSKFTAGTPPTVTKWDPATGATNVSRSKQIIITFSENIKAGNMFIELKTNTGTIIPITTSIGNNILKITPTSKLAANTKYTIYLHTGCVTDTAGNTLAGVTSKFTTGA
jgi:methionine-rich copper-binding protein CopC